MTGIRRLLLVEFPEAYQSDDRTFVICEFLFQGLLASVRNNKRRLIGSSEVTDADALELANAIASIPRTLDVQLGWALTGDPGGGVDAFVEFLRGGGFQMIDGEAVQPDHIRKSLATP